MHKTNKSVTKRIKITRRGKLIRRKSGQNHFNAKNSGTTGRKKHGFRPIAVADAKKLKRYAPFN